MQALAIVNFFFRDKTVRWLRCGRGDLEIGRTLCFDDDGWKSVILHASCDSFAFGCTEKFPATEEALQIQKYPIKYLTCVHRPVFII